MNRTALVLALLLACSKGSNAPAEKQLAEAPPPPALQIAPASGKAGELRIAVAHPRGVLTGAGRPTLTFNQPVVTLEQLGEGDASRGITLSPAVKGRWRWLGSSSIEFQNEEPFPGSTSFHVAVPAGLTALSGAKLQSAESIDFTTPPLEVQKYEVEPAEFLCKWSLPS